MIHRKQIEVGKVFEAPYRVTFGYQSERQAFSVWYDAADETRALYCAMGTGWDDYEKTELVASVCLDNGFTMVHLCRLKTEAQ